MYIEPNPDHRKPDQRARNDLRIAAVALVALALLIVLLPMAGDREADTARNPVPVSAVE